MIYFWFFFSSNTTIEDFIIANIKDAKKYFDFIFLKDKCVAEIGANIIRITSPVFRISK